MSKKHEHCGRCNWWYAAGIHSHGNCHLNPVPVSKTSSDIACSSCSLTEAALNDDARELTDKAQQILLRESGK